MSDAHKYERARILVSAHENASGEAQDGADETDIVDALSSTIVDESKAETDSSKNFKPPSKTGEVRER